MAKEHKITISEHQRQFLLKLVDDYIRLTEKKNFPVSEEVEKLDMILMLD